MKSIHQTLQEKASAAIKAAFPESNSLLDVALPAEVTQATSEKFGHYQCNSSLKLSKILKISPRLIAEKIVSVLSRDKDEMIYSLEIAGPGFINITLEPDYLSKALRGIFNDPRLGVPFPREKKKIIVEFSSPNIAKELHVGHLRSTIIGESLARYFEFLGHDVLRLNHIGDWGTQFGMLIAYLKEFVPEVLTGKQSADLPLLMQWYRASKQTFDADPVFKKKAQLEVINLQAKEKSTFDAWKKICEISERAYQEIYDLLDVSLEKRGESSYNEALPKIVQLLEEKNLVTLSGGAKCIFLEGYKNQEGNPLPMIIQKSDGGYNYSTTDMAAMYQRINREKADRIIVVTDAGQRLHFQMIVDAATKAGFFENKHVQFDHVTFGVVLGPDGKKFKTRSGETEKLIDLIEKAIDYAKVTLRARLEDASQEEISELAKVLGVDAIKYADLSCHRNKDYVFSYERMLKFEGNTAAFLLYAYVRIQGIKRKVNKSIDGLNASITLKHPSEIALGLHILQFVETLEMIERDLLPHRLAEYLYELSEKFHAFFRDCQVVSSPEEASRLLLSELTSRILEKGLYILGLKTMSRM